MSIMMSTCVLSLDYKTFLTTLRWEKFAPGPVRLITVGPDKSAPQVDDKGQPRPKGKPGRPRKDPNAKAQPKAAGRKRKAQPQDEVFTGERLESPMVAVPAAISGNGDNGDTLFQNHGAEPASQAVENPESSWPTRSTFAGRNNNGDVWEERRSAFYKSIPKTHWKDGEERKFWRLCVDSSVDDAVKKFLADVAVPSHTPTPGSAVKPRVKAKAKAKSAAKLRLPKETGRGRGRGRVKSKRGKAACRA